MTFSLSKENILVPSYRGRLTEGITYDPRNDSLIWIDIIVGEVHRISLSDTSKHEILKWKNPAETVGAIALTKQEDVLVVCSKYGLAKGDFSTGEIEYFFKYPHDEQQQVRLRSNDGIVDPWGHLWIGVMNDFNVATTEGIKPEGKLYRINTTDFTIETMVDNTLIANGLAFSEDGTKLFWTDSLTFTIWRFDYDYKTNTLSNKTPFIETKKIYPDFESPEPDGLVMTKDGDIYTTIFSTSTVLHVNAKGEVVEKISLPAERITCATIGGKQGDTLFVTTGHLDLEKPTCDSRAEDKDGDLGGFLFSLKLDRNLNGQPKNIWGGKL
ncbi:Gluconolactonase putatively [Spathaspora passalidarum NRRL Y-27907]|uniref:Gluconolactonase putatively n=1 Tax=Spathaspora passalidarum (strain NRRL Y-27907 / 11-Y1) TaxID=619300 RepID=G3AFV8_SPAPN|nr:Gluconolactonase putatively [Spathaspora passalidarum NRRL Y-27907]EGW35097.1 Gluconolactonase putatively [Spathaspora passalidarum NRRL Y-27907]